MTALPPDVVADLKQENARLSAELRAARDRQDASAEILRTIGNVSGDAQQSLHQIADTTKRLFEASSVSIFVAKDDQWGQIIHDGASSQRIGAEIPAAQLRIGGHSLPGAAFSENRQIHLPDIDNVDPAIADWPGLRPARAAGTRTLSGTPLRHAGRAIGVLIVHRDRLAPFSAEELALLQNFADQAAIAIENARLFNENREALERQAASAEILRAIASTPGDAERPLQQIAETTARLFDCHSVRIRIAENGEWSRTIAVGASAERVGAEVSATQGRIGGKNLPSTVVLENRQIHIRDMDNLDPAMTDWPGLPPARAAGTRTLAGTPLRREGKAIGVLIVYRYRLAPFTAEELALLQSFADQAVIAIENARLFNETKEALERQTATADILKVIASSPSDVQPVFEAIATSSNKLIGGFSTAVLRFIGDELHLAAFTPTNPTADAALKASFPGPISKFPPFMLVRNGETVQFADTEAEDVPPLNRELARLRGYRSMLFTPLMSSGAPIGLISVTRREPGKFAPHHAELVRTFADQAVIAIENVRLFDEVQAKTRDLTEALTYQTGSSNILSVIASSPTDVGPALKAIVESACELCDAQDAVVSLREGDDLRSAAHHGPIPVGFEKRTISRSWVTGRAVVDKVPIHLRDAFSAEGDEFPEAQEMSRRVGIRTLLSVPLLRQNESIGAIMLRRTEVNPFNDKQIALLQTFADQAVIALGNVRLFEEVQARTEDLRESLQQQTATSEVLEVISSSPGELEPVFNSMLKNAVSICDAQFGNLFLIDSDGARWEAGVGTPPKLAQYFTQSKSFRPTPGSHLDRVMRTKQVSHTADDTAEAVVGAAARLGGARSTVCVPMVKDEALVGAIFIYRTEVRPFTDKQIDLVKNFAAQAVIAIENTRLLKELHQRTDDLTASLDELRTAQDRLVQTEKLASLGQLTAGIAHEIKNPLNFVNNFAALSAELTDELNDVLKSAALSDKLREEVDELTQTLKDNLERVVQHGKRADSIVKNMLLHSREGSGDHRPADINALLDESLNLAYHGARAEKPQFNVTLQRDFDEMAGTIEVFPQEITRVFLNLISNGFYAVTKRKAENDNSGFEPLLSATTRNLGNTVEIRIRDNGTGIPAEVKEKMFNPFFTTKPAGEGTGLGLSMSHDIIVKQHGGTIDVETEPGQFTEFTIVLPRTSNLQDKKRGET